MNIFSVIFYFFAICITIGICSLKMKRGGRYLVHEKQKKIKVWIIIFIAMLFTLYNYYCTLNSSPIENRHSSDRYNYYYEFLGYRKTSEGLTFIFQLVKIFTSNFEWVLYFTSFICCVITFFVYRITKEKSTWALLFLFFTDIIFTMFINLKQCYANAFIALMIALSMGERKIYKDIICICCVSIALRFHSAAIVGVPIFLFLRFNKWQKNNFALITILVVALFLFIEPLLLSLSSLIRPIYPYGADKILEYFASDTIHKEEGSIFSFVKGVPFYFIAIMGCIKRKDLKIVYCNYDNYLFVSILGALFYMSSISSYWLYRGTALLYLPISILYGMLCENMQGRKKVIFLIVTLVPHIIVFCRWIILMCVNYGSI